MSWSGPPDRDAAGTPAVEALPQRAADVFGPRLAVASRYADLLVDPGIAHGVIGPREASRIWTRHVLHCAAITELVPTEAAVADLGSGAGLPGIPLAIARPDVQVDLVEPMARRVRFLTSVLSELALANVSVVTARAAEHARATTARYDVVTARAVADLATLCTWSLSMLRSGGELLAMKGERAGVEVRDAAPVLTRLGAVATVETVGSRSVGAPLTVVRVRRVAE